MQCLPSTENLLTNKYFSDINVASKRIRSWNHNTLPPERRQEMTEYLLAAVSHDPATGQLFSRGSLLMFNELVAPRITNNSLILCEGMNHKILVRGGHPMYARLNDEVLRLPESVRPTLGGFDFRQKGSLEANMANLARYDGWEDTLRELIDTDRSLRPETLRDVMCVLETTPPAATLKRKPTPKEAELASWVGGQSRKLDRVYLEAMQKYGRKFDHCIFVAGAIHIISVHLKTGYQMADLVLPGDVPATLYGYLADHKWARLISEAKS